MTDLRKAQNRMAFGKEEKEVGYGTGEGTVGMGMIGQQNDGRIRALQVDNRTRAKLSAKNKGWGTGSTVGSIRPSRPAGTRGTSRKVMATSRRARSRAFPERRTKGTPAHRQLSTSNRSAAYVSVTDSGSTPGSSRYPGISSSRVPPRVYWPRTPTGSTAAA